VRLKRLSGKICCYWRSANLVSIIDLNGNEKKKPMETLLPLLGFVIVSTVTPGPNNLMVLTSGANFGLSRTLPHILGIALGFPVLLIAMGLGLGFVFEAYPVLHRILKYVAFAYLLWIAWQITQAGRPETGESGARPLTLLQAAAFQWVNPKAWALMFGAMALFMTDGGNKVVEIGLIALFFGLACVPNGVAWALFGQAIARFLEDDRQRHWFNIGMAALLVVSVVPTLF
jgi:threonine/homoserine/homoserine lactone efflux protein